MTNKKLKEQFRAAVHSLNEVIAEMRLKYPKAEYYLANDELHLMKGPSHTDSINPKAIYSNSIASETLDYSGGGDW